MWGEILCFFSGAGSTAVLQLQALPAESVFPGWSICFWISGRGSGGCWYPACCCSKKDKKRKSKTTFCGSEKLKVLWNILFVVVLKPFIPFSFLYHIFCRADYCPLALKQLFSHHSGAFVEYQPAGQPCHDYRKTYFISTRVMKPVMFFSPRAPMLITTGAEDSGCRVTSLYWGCFWATAACTAPTVEDWLRYAWSSYCCFRSPTR